MNIIKSFLLLIFILICVTSVNIFSYPIYLAKFETMQNKHVYVVANQNTQDAVRFDMAAFNQFKRFFDGQEKQKRRTLVLFEGIQNKEKYDTSYNFLNITRDFLEHSQFNFITTINTDLRIFADELMKIINILLNDSEENPENFNSRNFEKTRDAYYEKLNINMHQYLKYLHSIKLILLKKRCFLGTDFDDHEKLIKSFIYYNPEEEHFLETIFANEGKAIPSIETLKKRALRLHDFWNIHYCTFEDYLLKNINHDLDSYDNVVLISYTMQALLTDIELQKKLKKICTAGIKEEDFDPTMLYTHIRDQEIEQFFKNSKSRRSSMCYKIFKLANNIKDTFIDFIKENPATKLKEF